MRRAIVCAAVLMAAQPAAGEIIPTALSPRQNRRYAELRDHRH